MERQIGRLGIAPITAIGIGHNGDPGINGGPEFYLNDKLNLNIVYSVYFTPRTREEIGDELGVSPAFLDDRLTFLEENGFIVKTTGKRYTTYVCFEPETNSLQLADRLYEIRLQAAKTLVEEYVPIVRDAITDIEKVYIPSGNRELFEAAVIFYAVANKCGISIEKDLSKYFMKTTAGGDFYTIVDLPQTLSDPEYEPAHDLTSCWACGSMWRSSEKYPSVASWSVDSKYCSRKDNWKNNLTSDYEYLYEYIGGNLPETTANKEKYKRLKEKEFLTEDNQVNIMIVEDSCQHFFEQIPTLDENIKRKFADVALEFAMIYAKHYPSQMQDLVISHRVREFIGVGVAVMVMDILYENGTFKVLTEREKVTSGLLMFSDIFPL